MPDARAIIRQITAVRRELDALERMVAGVPLGTGEPLGSGVRRLTPADVSAPINGTAIDIEAICRSLDIAISPDGFISESGFAAIVGKSEYTVRNWRYISRPIPFRKIGRRIEYRSRDVAAFLASGAMADE